MRLEQRYGLSGEISLEIAVVPQNPPKLPSIIKRLNPMHQRIILAWNSLSTLNLKSHNYLKTVHEKGSKPIGKPKSGYTNMTTNNRNSSLAVVILFSLGALGLNAQTAPDDAALKATIDTTAVEVTHPFTISPEVGTTGAGATVGWRFADHFGVRAGLDYFPYSYSGSMQDAQYNLKFRLMSEPVAFEWFPSRKSSFRLSLGALINQNQFTGANGSAESITVNGNTYTVPAGALSLKLKQPTVLPFASLGGNIYLGRKHHWSLGGELGAAYGKWDASFTDSSGLISAADVAAERSKVQNAANKFPVWPIIKLNISYSF